MAGLLQRRSKSPSRRAILAAAAGLVVCAMLVMSDLGSTLALELAAAGPTARWRAAGWKNELLPGEEPLTAEALAAPWLLPPRSAALPWAGARSLEEVLQMRGRPKGGQPKAVTFLLFDNSSVPMTLNTVYTMAKFGGVDNYFFGCWDDANLQACRDLNLPCADVSRFLPAPLPPSTGGAAKLYGSKDYCVITWIKPMVVQHLLGQGYAVHCTDTDIAYGPHPVWASYLRLLAASAADGAFQLERPLNTGNYVLLPTPASLAMAAAWAARASESLSEAGRCENDQDALSALEGSSYDTCRDDASCQDKAQLATDARDTRARLRLYPSAAARYAAPGETDAWCGFGTAAWAPPPDPCHPSALYVHPICAPHHDKAPALKRVGYWLVDEEAGCKAHEAAASGVLRCLPAVLAGRADAEDEFGRCDKSRLALTARGGGGPR